MTTVSPSSINLSVKNATDFINSIKTGERILSFYLGSIDTSSVSSNSEERRNRVYQEASFFKKIEKSEVDIVAKRITFGSSAYQTWNSYSDNSNNFYTVANNKVYLVIGNDIFNRQSENEKNIAASIPTHTSGVQKYSDGYEYLYLYTLAADNKLITSNNLWIPVPDTDFSQYRGKLLYKKIDADSISDVVISYKNPEIPILSDTGSGAKIRLLTQVQTSPSTTISNRKYKIIGIEVVHIGQSLYKDFDLLSSLQAVLTKESGSVIQRIYNAITIGFSSPEQFNLRNLLQARYSIISLVANSTDISSVIEQTQFNSFGVVEDITDDSGVKIFDGSASTQIVSNNVKITATPLIAVTNETIESDFAIKTAITLQNKTKYQKGKVAFRSVSGGGTLTSEIEVKDKNDYAVSDTIKTAKSEDRVYVINSVTVPPTKAFSGRVLHINDASFSISTDSTKTFVAQVIQKF